MNARWLLALLAGEAAGGTPADSERSTARVEPFRSVWTRVSGNGYGILTFDSDRLTQAWEHVYQQYDPTTPTYDLLYDSYFGYSGLDGSGNWLTDPAEVRVEPGSGIITSIQVIGDLEFTQYAFMPITFEGWGVAQVTRVRNASDSARTNEFQINSLHNYKPGGSETVATYDAERVTERGSYATLYYRAPGAIEATCEGAYEMVLAGRNIAGDCSGYMSDAVPSFGWNVPSLGPGEEYWASVFTSQSPSPAWDLLESAPRDWLLAELAAWAGVQARVVLPPGLNEDESAVFRQQIAYFRMVQSRELGAAFGQIPASFPVAAPVEEFPHTWAITWVRDSTYSIVALAGAGFADEAVDALAFLFQPEKAGEYASYVGDLNYGISVARLYGDGTEWSDDDGTGPNIELDGWGSFLWAFDEAWSAIGADDTLTELAPRALDEVADPLVAMISAENGLITADSSIWERHWNGNQKQFAYTSIMAVAGLRAAGNIAERLGDSRADSYRLHAESIADAIAEHLVDGDGVLAGSLEELQAGIGYLDISAVEAYNMDVLDPRSETFGPTLEMWDAWLRVETGTGYMRNDDGSAYDAQEWAFADLRLAPPLRRACAIAQAEGLEDWITQSAMQNDRQIPELFQTGTGAFAGPTPMIGFGAGLYILAMKDREVNSAICPETVPPVFDTPVDAVYTPACECGGENAGLVAAPLGAGLAWFRRRRMAKPAG